MNTILFIVLLIGDFLFPPSAIPLFSLLYYGAKWLKLKAKLDLYTIYFMAIILPQLVIFGILHVFNLTGHKIAHIIMWPFQFLHLGLNALEEKPKISAIPILTMVFIGFFTFPLELSSLTDPGSWVSNFLNLIIILMFGILPVLFLASIYAKISKKDYGSIKSYEASGRYKKKFGEQASNTKNLASDAKSSAKGAKSDVSEYRDLRSDSVEKIEKAGSWIPENAERFLTKYKNTIPFLGKKGAKKAGKKAAAGQIAERGAQMAKAGKELKTVSLLPLMIVGGIIILFQVLLIAGLFFSFFNVYMPVIGEPMMEAAGLGGAYADYAGEATTNRYGGAVADSGVWQEVSLTLSQTGQKLKCAAQGPQCMRQWRLNNTKEPGSREVGEEYGLSVESFRLGSGEQVDIAYKEKSYTIPVSFRIRNARNGLKGINARDLEYRIKILDFDQGENAPYCQTDWVPVNGYDIDGDGQSNDLYPGTSAGTGFTKLDGSNGYTSEGNTLTLDNCNMLTPGAGEVRNVKLYVKYKYSSQATLNFEAMSREYQNSEAIDVEPKDSKTADTPVKAAMTVDTPAIFDTANRANDQPVSMRATLNTDNRDIEYQVDNYRLSKSQKTCVKGSGERCNSAEPLRCSFVQSGDRENSLELSSDAKKQLISGYDEDDGIPSDFWFSDTKKPGIFGCLFSLKNQQFNPSGETLTVGVRANYTVKLEDRLDNFKVLNSECRRMNCPLTFPIDASQDNIRGVVISSTDSFDRDQGVTDYWKKQRALCDGPDAYDGCIVTDTYTTNYDELRSAPTIDQGDVAIRMNSAFLDQWPEYFSCRVKNSGISGDAEGTYGVNLNRLEDMFLTGSNRVLDYRNGEWTISSPPNCNQESSSSSSSSSNMCDDGETVTQGIKGPDETWDEAAGCNCGGEWQQYTQSGRQCNY